MVFLESLFDCFFSVFNYLVSSEEFIILFAAFFVIGSAGLIYRIIKE